MLAGARSAASNILESTDLLGFSHTVVFVEFPKNGVERKTSSERQFSRPKCLADERGQTVWPDRFNLTEINHSLQGGKLKSISEHITLRLTSYNGKQVHIRTQSVQITPVSLVHETGTSI